MNYYIRIFLAISLLPFIFFGHTTFAREQVDFIDPMVWAIPFNKIAQVACHNCYERQYAETLSSVLDNVRVIEIDFWDQSNGIGGGSRRHWFVRHNLLSGNDNNCSPNDSGEHDLEACLKDIERWSDQHSKHFPITVVLDKKQGWSKQSSERTPKEFDELVAGVFGEKLFTPGDLSNYTGNLLPLQTALKGRDWPTAEALQGKIILVLNHTENQKLSQYAEQRKFDARVFISPVTNGSNDISGEVSGMSRESSNYVAMNNMSSDNKSWAEIAFNFNHIARVYGDDGISFVQHVYEKINISAYYNFKNQRDDRGYRIRPF